MFETVETLNYCHKKKIIHRDIKLENIFFKDRSQKDIKIGDYGISSIVEEDKSKVLTGIPRTEIYAVPELYISQQGKTIITEKMDYYASGITLPYLYTGKNPFEGYLIMPS